MRLKGFLCVHNRQKLALFTLPTVLDFFYRTPTRSTWDRFRAGSQATHAKSRRLYHLLPINEERSGPLFCKALMSSLVHGYSPVLLNWEAQGDGSYMQRMKITGVYEFLRNLTTSDDNDVVFMMDALDVWLQLSPNTLLDRYAEFRGMVVVGADKACWPNAWDEPACRDVPESPVPKIAYGSELESEDNGSINTRPRWANSGTVIGTVRSMRNVYRDLASQISGDAFTEQGIFNEFLHEGRLTLDYWSHLFWANAANVDSGVILNVRYPVSSTKDDVIPYRLLPPMLYHTQTGEFPVAIHFNDHLHKDLMNDWWGRLWWTKQDIAFKRIWEKKVEMEGQDLLTTDQRCDGRIFAVTRYCRMSLS
ncbi:hypothetical protein B0H10DRAFT_1066922 [Mycena sp. CBHHK59/15]|nr:hypothetical protein B0H10DRAFT_1066922 [Mycena sp. CBHHK59/15]